MARSERVTVTMENAHIMWTNFAGEAKQYNREGDRNFCVRLDDRLAAELAEKGWNVKVLKPRDEDDEPTLYLKVAVSYKVRAPQVYLIAGQHMGMLDEGAVGMLDTLESSNVDITFTAYDWEMNGRTGRKAFLQTMFFTMYQDRLMEKYAGYQQMSVTGERMSIESGVIDAEVVEDDD